MNLADKARRLRELHAGSDMLVMPNAWDVASARRFERMGYPAIATTSGGVAASLGWKDQQNMPADEMFAAVKRMATAVDVPVTADIEAGYGLEPAEVVRRVIQSGAAGFNIEDSDYQGSDVLVGPRNQSVRIAALRAEADRAGLPLVINARVDVFVRQYGEEAARVDEAIRRGRMYLAAGADCVYPILVSDEAAIQRLVEGMGGPINVMYLPNGPSPQALAELGVRRLTFGGGLAHFALQAVDAEMRRLWPPPDAS